jgi:hypothetical protein
MKEKRTEVRTYVVRLMCEKCDGGEMLPTGIALMSSPPKYPHKCNKCGHEDTPRGGKRYPRTEHEE